MTLLKKDWSQGNKDDKNFSFRAWSLLPPDRACSKGASGILKRPAKNRHMQKQPSHHLKYLLVYIFLITKVETLSNNLSQRASQRLWEKRTEYAWYDGEVDHFGALHKVVNKSFEKKSIGSKDTYGHVVEANEPYHDWQYNEDAEHFSGTKVRTKV